MNIETIQSIEVDKGLGTKIIEIGPDIDFVYIMRGDTHFTMSPMVSKFSQTYGIDDQSTGSFFEKNYDEFTNRLAIALQGEFAAKFGEGKNTVVHLFSPNDLEESVRTHAGTLPIISMDPLLAEGAYTLPVSRGYFLSGITDFGPVTRPGNEAIDAALTAISHDLSGQPVSLAEDDIYSGGTVVSMIKKLQSHGVNVTKVISGIQIGEAKEITDMDISIEPAIKYTNELGAACPEKIDLGDPRDFLLGASGLVVKLPSGKYGRLPYILPFVSSTARCSLPQETEEKFARDILQLNLAFFSSIEAQTGHKVLLGHMDPYFVLAMNELFGYSEDTPMDEIVVWAHSNLPEIWSKMQALGSQMEKEQI